MRGPLPRDLDRYLQVIYGASLASHRSVVRLYRLDLQPLRLDVRGKDVHPAHARHVIRAPADLGLLYTVGRKMSNGCGRPAICLWQSAVSSRAGAVVVGR